MRELVAGLVALPERGEDGVRGGAAWAACALGPAGRRQRRGADESAYVEVVDVLAIEGAFVEATLRDESLTPTPTGGEYGGASFLVFCFTAGSRKIMAVIGGSLAG